MSEYTTHCALRLGDNLAALHLLRELSFANPGASFTHYAHACYLPNLIEVVCDMDSIRLRSLESVQFSKNPEVLGRSFWEMKPKEYSIDMWKNQGNFWSSSRNRLDYAKFYIEYCHKISDQLGMDNPITETDDILFDYPALNDGYVDFPSFDFLVINSKAMSGQFHDSYHFIELILDLNKKYKVITTERVGDIPCTSDWNLSVSKIGELSRKCNNIVMVSTGPSWPTFNVFNKDTVDLRIVLIQTGERINLSPNTFHATTIHEATNILKIKGKL